MTVGLMGKSLDSVRFGNNPIRKLLIDSAEISFLTIFISHALTKRNGHKTLYVLINFVIPMSIKATLTLFLQRKKER